MNYIRKIPGLYLKSLVVTIPIGLSIGLYENKFKITYPKYSQTPTCTERVCDKLISGIHDISFGVLSGVLYPLSLPLYTINKLEKAGYKPCGEYKYENKDED